MRVLGFGTYDLANHPRIGIVLEGLRAHGDDVVEANAPLGFSTRERVEMLEKPWLGYRFVVRLFVRWWQLTMIATRARRHGRFDTVLVGYMGHFDVLLARLLFPRGRVVLDLMVFAADTARDRGVDSGLKLRLLGALDRLAVAAASFVLVDTDEHALLLSAATRHKAVVVPVGAPPNWFVPEPQPHARDGVALRVVFFGLYAPLQGTNTIGEALAKLASHPEIQTTMIGDGQDRESTWEAANINPNITWLDWVDHKGLAEMIAGYDVCLGIFGTGPKALRVVPNKVYQGAAAGCVIVTSDTEPQRRALGDGAVYIPPGDAEALNAALLALARDPDRVAHLRAETHKIANERFTPFAVVFGLRAQLLADAGLSR